ncbi:MAG: cytochrome c biogenesis protein CcsA [Myxococcales bacterium]|nr:cytochrome c biogenesis protein CcsA [Myxococcales bacterium]
MYLSLTIATLLIYLLGAFSFSVDLFSSGDRFAKLGVRIIALGALLNAVTAVVGIASLGLGAMVALPNGLGLVSLSLVLGFLVTLRFQQVEPIGVLVAPLALVNLIAVVVLGPHVEVSPSLRGGILPVHITMSLVGTAAFGLAFFAAVLYLVQSYQLKQKRFGPLFRALPSLHELDRLNFRAISIGFPIYTAAILLGAIWFSRDPGNGENHFTTYALAVLSWLLYGIVLQARLTAGWRGTKAAVMTVVGFVAAASVLVAYMVR